MAAWLIAALALLGGIGRRTVASRVGKTAVTVGAGALGGEVLEEIGFPGFADDDKPKRRRRRRALTSSDKADIAFVAGLLGPKAGKDLATVIATRAR